LAMSSNLYFFKKGKSCRRFKTAAA